MAPKAVSGKAAKKAFKVRTTEVNKTKRRKESYAIYIYKVLHQVHPDTGLSSKAMSIMKLFVNDFFEQTVAESIRLAHYNKQRNFEISCSHDSELLSFFIHSTSHKPSFPQAPQFHLPRHIHTSLSGSSDDRTNSSASNGNSAVFSCVPRTHENLIINTCCVQGTPIQNSISVIRLVLPTNQSAKLHLRLSGDPEAAACGLAGIRVALRGRAKAALLGWIPVDRLYAVRFRCSCKVGSRRYDCLSCGRTSQRTAAQMQSEMNST
ncbi:unnamed protein product [Echinostoma caproni]|uniref:Histone domain-containing protein n=1 Tax=Echinostoma caproni TaxID=27848 RepID=A0A183A6M6_9TREM|nr:unnamed protein product [Echinostoma caproni]